MKVKELFEAASPKFGDPSLIKSEDDFDNWMNTIDSISTTPRHINSKYTDKLGTLSFAIDDIHFNNFEKFVEAMVAHGYKAKGDEVYKFTEDYPKANTVLTKGKSKITIDYEFHQVSISIKF